MSSLRPFRFFLAPPWFLPQTWYFNTFVYFSSSPKMNHLYITTSNLRTINIVMPHKGCVNYHLYTDSTRVWKCCCTSAVQNWLTVCCSVYTELHRCPSVKAVSHSLSPPGWPPRTWKVSWCPSSLSSSRTSWTSLYSSRTTRLALRPHRSATSRSLARRFKPPRWQTSGGWQGRKGRVTDRRGSLSSFYCF